MILKKVKLKNGDTVEVPAEIADSYNDGLRSTDPVLKAHADAAMRIVDSVPHMDAFRGDVQTGRYAQQLVLVTLREVFRHEFPTKKWINGGLIDISTTIDEGAKEYSYTEVVHSGKAQIVADNATDLPAAEVTGRNNIRGIKTVAEYITYSTQDIRTGRLQGLWDIASEKAVAAREAMDWALDDLIRTGNEEAALRGITNAPGIVVQNAINGDWQNPATTGVQIVEDVTSMLNSVTNDTDGVDMVDTVVFDIPSWNTVSTKVHLPNASDGTVLNFLRSAFPMVRRWDFEYGMKNADATGTGPAVLAYRNERTRCRAVFPMLMRPLPPQQNMLNFSLAFESRFGGVMVPRPRAVIRLDGVGA